MTFVFGQTPIAEDETVIQYSTNWGSWITAPNNSNILFCARLKWYDKKTKLYAWDVKWKVTRMPIAFEWKITNQVFTGASDTPEENDGYYTSSIYDIKDNTNSMNSSGFAIYSTSKTTLYYQVRNVCYEFEERNPNCEQTKLTTSTNQTNNSSTNPKVNDTYSKGVPKEYTGNMSLNFDFKTLFKYLTDETTREQVKQLFLNSGFKLCENCFQGSDYVTLAKNNESFTVRVKKEYSGGKRISIQIPKVCPNLISLFQSWINTSELVPFKKKTFGLHYIYENKYDLWTSNDNNSNDVDWTWVSLSTWDVKDFQKENGLIQDEKKDIPIKNNSTHQSQINKQNIHTSKDNSLSEIKKYVHKADWSIEATKIKEIFTKAGYKYQTFIEDEFDGNIYKFDKIKVNVFEDGVNIGFHIDFITKDELLKFKKANENDFQGMEILEFDAQTFRILYSYKK